MLAAELPRPQTDISQSLSRHPRQPGPQAPFPHRNKMQRRKIPADFGDLSSAVTARKNAQAAEELDPSIYDYDGAYDSFKPEKQRTKEDVERKPKYLGGLVAAAALRNRDRLIAEEKKIAREREAEGEEFAGKEKFVTEAYKKQQEENRRLQEEEVRREEAEARKNKSGGMTGFYKDLLDQGDRRHAGMVKAAQERKSKGANGSVEAEQTQDEKTEADIAREINDKGGKVAVNEDGQVVDKRQLLKGGLNIGAKKKVETQQEKSRRQDGPAQRTPGNSFIGAGGKQAMRERQSRMLEEQLEQSLKRSRNEEEEERRKVELAAKSRKTESDVSSAKERYLARKKAAEEEKRKAAGD
jgi:coiled-coil domain-containing protein 55